MKTRIIQLIGIFLLAFLLHLQGVKAASDGNTEELEVKNVIEYAIDAMYNKGDIELIKTHYHPDYELLLLVEGNKLYKMSLNERIQHVKEGQQNQAYPPKEHVSIKFEFVDVAYSTATVKFDYFRAGRQTCIDIMTLYKFEEGWRIVSQTTHHVQD